MPDEKAITDARTAAKLLRVCAGISLVAGLLAVVAVIVIGSDSGTLGLHEYLIMLACIFAGVLGFGLLYAIASIAENLAELRHRLSGSDVSDAQRAVSETVIRQPVQP